MSHSFDDGYGASPWRELVARYPGTEVYPSKDFRTEWGPIFHRGRLDGTARVLVLGQDPGQHESIGRRILVGEAGQRVQGLLARLGIHRSYVMVNAFLYSVYGQHGGEAHRKDPAIAAYRNDWLQAVFNTSPIQAVLAIGSLAADAWKQFLMSPAGGALPPLTYAHVRHPTWPESSSKGDKVKYAANMKQMLAEWSLALKSLSPAVTPDIPRPLAPYGEVLQPGDVVEIPELDMPAGTPPWMRGLQQWAERSGADAKSKRATVVVTIPKDFWP
jgi:uracil-DNA glycosylase